MEVTKIILLITGAIIFVPGFLITTSPDKVRNWLKECSFLPMTTRIKYWEGGCLVEGEIRGQRLKGKGYMELVGYQWSDFSFLKWGSQTIISGLFSIFP